MAVPGRIIVFLDAGCERRGVNDRVTKRRRSDLTATRLHFHRRSPCNIPSPDPTPRRSFRHLRNGPLSLATPLPGECRPGNRSFPIDHDITLLEMRRNSAYRLIHQRSGQHQPEYPRHGEPCQDLCNRFRSRCPSFRHEYPTTQSCTPFKIRLTMSPPYAPRADHSHLHIALLIYLPDLLLHLPRLFST